MSLEHSRLERLRQSGNKLIARCPACAEFGRDSAGEHLFIMGDGRFGCVVNSGPSGSEHRQRIFALVGDKRSVRGGNAAGNRNGNNQKTTALNRTAEKTAPIQIRSPPKATPAKFAGTVFRLDSLGRFGRVFGYTSEEGKTPQEAEKKEPSLYNPGVGENPSKTSHEKDGGFFDPETGYPIINGAIYPF